MLKPLFWCSIFPLFAEMNLLFLDRNLSPYVGAENLIAIQQGMERVEDRLYSQSLSPDPSSPLPDAEHWSRWLRECLFWFPVSLISSVTQHEIFGHGYRTRDLGASYATVAGYSVHFLGGRTDLAITEDLTPGQMLTTGIAGLEADEILSGNLRYKWLKNNSIDARQANLYLFSKIAFLGYALVSYETPKRFPDSGNDISGCLFLLNTLYPEGHVTDREVRLLSFLQLLDPLLFWSIYSQVNYQKYGTPTSPFSLQVGPIRFLPVMSAALTPFGLQGTLDTYFLSDVAPTCLSLKWGKNGPNTYYGFALENREVFRSSFATLGFRGSVWHQPLVLFQKGALSMEELMEWPEERALPQLYPKEVVNRKQWGVLTSLIGTLGKEEWVTRPFYEIGYKTDGYFPGEALRQSAIIRLGLIGSF